MPEPRPALRHRMYIYGVVLIAATGGVMLALGVRALDVHHVFVGDRDVLGNYLQLIGGIYAVVIGFVIFVVWNQFNDATRALEQEAGRLAALNRLCGDLPAHAESLREDIRKYATAVLAALGRQRASAARDEHSDLTAWRSLVKALRATPSTDSRETVIYSDILRQLDALTVVRNERHSILRARIPWILWDLLIFASVVTILPFTVLSVESTFVDSLIVGSISGALAFLLLVVHDLDDPFVGVFNISTEPFERLLQGDEYAA